MEKNKIGLMWFRRDLRLDDNAALYHALRESSAVHCVFIFDTTILNKLNSYDRRVEFIHDAVIHLKNQLQTLTSDLHILIGDPVTLIPKLADTLNTDAVYTNIDHEPYAKIRDHQVKQSLEKNKIAFNVFKDHMIFDHHEVLKQDGKPYTVFTPYKNAWLKKLTAFYLKPYPSKHYIKNLAHYETPLTHAPSLDTLGFQITNLHTLNLFGTPENATELFENFITRMHRYHLARDFPGIKGVSYLSVHLRFGTLSIRTLARFAYETMQTDPDTAEGASIWLNELVWRDFYFQILANFPHVVHQSFKPDYDAILWDTNEAYWQAWCDGKTGYPLVDAGMRQLNQTGYMHNRLRMVVASFLTKDLGISWQRGEQYFAQHLNDFDLAANNGGWQWAASTGCDAQPYFRIFNPITQSEKFDPDGKFIRKYVPEIANLPNRSIHAPWTASATTLQDAKIVLGQDYPLPIIDHAIARQRTLQRYQLK